MRFRKEHPPWRPFTDRADAAARLAYSLEAFDGDPRVTALGLARGGVPIAVGAAGRLGVASDVLLVRKLGVPANPEVAFGALAVYGGLAESIHLAETMRRLAEAGVPAQDLQRVEERERAELGRRQSAYLQGAQPSLAGRTVLLCDDGMATGATMRAAVRLMRACRAAVVLVCVPVAPADTCRLLAEEADDVVCVQPRRDLQAVSQAYRTFGQVSDAEMLRLLRDGP